MSDKVKVVIVDDHQMVRRGISDILQQDDELTVVGEASDGISALNTVARLKPDVVILDIRLPSFSGIEVARRLKRQFPTVRILCITSYEDETTLAAAVQAGIDGFALKTIPAAELVCAVRDVSRGESFIQRPLVAPLFRRYASASKKAAMSEADLSELDVEVLRLIEAGASNHDIAERFSWSESTCKRRIQVIFDKLGATDRAQAIASAIRRGVV